MRQTSFECNFQARRFGFSLRRWAAHQRVLDQAASVGVAASLPNAPPSLSSERLAGVPLVMVASRHHPLALYSGIIPKSELAKHVQLVLTDRSALSAGVEFAVMSSSVWRLTDLFAKHAFLLNGLGWGGMPVHAVERDISEGGLVGLSIEDAPPSGIIVPMSAIYPTSAPPGPAGRWFIERLKRCTKKWLRPSLEASPWRGQSSGAGTLPHSIHRLGRWSVSNISPVRVLVQVRIKDHVSRAAKRLFRPVPKLTECAPEVIV
jgi:hypothetical protein